MLGGKWRASSGTKSDNEGSLVCIGRTPRRTSQLRADGEGRPPGGSQRNGSWQVPSPLPWLSVGDNKGSQLQPWHGCGHRCVLQADEELVGRQRRCSQEERREGCRGVWGGRRAEGDGRAEGLVCGWKGDTEEGKAFLGEAGDLTSQEPGQQGQSREKSGRLLQRGGWW